MRCFMICMIVLGLPRSLTAQINPPQGGAGFLTCTSGSPFDRYYQFGDDAGESGIAGNPAGTFVNGSIVTFDSIGTPMAGDFNDLTVVGSPLYSDSSSLPFGGGGVGIQFDGVGDYLVGENLNWPQESRSSIAYIDDTANPAPGPCNYTGIVNRSLQFWVRPDSAGLGDGAVQSLVVDSNQHGVLISDADTWVLRYNGTDVDSGVAVGTDWQHVQVSRPFGAGGPSGGARLWVDGIAVAAAGGDYSASRVDLVIGANTANDENGSFTGGTGEFFAGDMDRLFFTVHGDSSADAGPPIGQDYGAFNFATQNDYAASTLSGVAADLNNDGTFDAADRTAFIDGWMNENIIDGLRAGDLTSLASGDLNFDGTTDIFDLVDFQRELIASGQRPISAGELVPEPNSTLLLLMGVLTLVFHHRRKN